MPPVIVGTNTLFGGANLSDGVMVTATYRSRHLAARAITSLQLTYINGVGTAENGTATVTYKCAIEYNGQVFPCFFAGARTLAVVTGAKATTDALAVVIPAGATFWVRTNVAVTAGGRWGLTATMNRTPAPPYGDGVTTNLDVVDATGFLAAGANNSALVVPIAITNQDATDSPSVVIYGDSIPTGGSDTQDGIYDLGYIVRALNRTPAGVAIPYANLSLGGETMQGIVGGSGALRRGLPTSIGFRDAIVAYGTNDIAAGRTGAQVIADLQSFFTTLNTLGLRVWGVTILPRTTSTDAFITIGNQTPMAGFAPGGHRDTVNNWLRTLPGPLAGLLDASDAVESTRGSGVWRIGSPSSDVWTADGTHPTSVASKAMAAMVPISQFAIAPGVQRLA